MQRRLALTFAITAMLVFVNAAARADNLRDPCKLLTPAEIQRTLGLVDPVVLQPSAGAPVPLTANPISVPGNLVTLLLIDEAAAATVPATETPIKTSLLGAEALLSTLHYEHANAPFCEAEGDNFVLRASATPVEQARIVGSNDSNFHQLATQILKETNQQLSSGKTVCDQVLNPAVAEREPNNWQVVRMDCYARRGETRVLVTALPARPTKNLPFSRDQLSSLTGLAASHLPHDMPVGSSNNH